MNSREFDVLLRYVRHDTNEMTLAMAVVAAGGTREGAKVLTGIYAALKNGGFLVGGGLGRGHKKPQQHQCGHPAAQPRHDVGRAETALR